MRSVMSGSPAGPGTVRSSMATAGLGGSLRAALSCSAMARRSAMSGIELNPPGRAAFCASSGTRNSGSIRSRADMGPP